MYHQLMRLHALNGDRAAALRVYHACVSALSRELDAPPSRPTREAYERLLQIQPASQPPVRTKGPALVGRQQEWQLLLVLATARSEEIDKEHPLHKLLLTLRREGQLQEHELPRLDV